MSTSYDKGVYGIASGYGALPSRLILAPVEEIGRGYFFNSGKSTKGVSSSGGDEQDFNERIFGERDSGVVNDGGDSILKAYSIIDEINAKYDAELAASEHPATQATNARDDMERRREGAKLFIVSTFFVS